MARFKGKGGWFPVVRRSNASDKTKEYTNAMAAGSASFLKSHHSHEVWLAPHSVFMLARCSEHLG
jgi:hypothetical protein